MHCFSGQPRTLAASKNTKGYRASCIEAMERIGLDASAYHPCQRVQKGQIQLEMVHSLLHSHRPYIVRLSFSFFFSIALIKLFLFIQLFPFKPRPWPFVLDRQSPLSRVPVVYKRFQCFWVCYDRRCPCFDICNKPFPLGISWYPTKVPILMQDQKRFPQLLTDLDSMPLSAVTSECSGCCCVLPKNEYFGWSSSGNGLMQRKWVCSLVCQIPNTMTCSHRPSSTTPIQYYWHQLWLWPMPH